jgi:sugar phosphate isomerase/epimerase
MNDIGLSTSLFETFEPQKHLPLFAQHGIGQVELSINCFAFWSDEARMSELRQVLDATGIRVNSIHAPFGAEFDISSPEEDVRWRGIDAAALCAERLDELGGRCVVVHASGEPIEDAERAERLERSIESFREIEQRLSESNRAILAIEHLPRTCLCHDSEEILDVLEQLDSVRFAICQDVNHANLREDICVVTRRYGSQIATLHISDNDGIDERHWMPGQGVLPWPEWKEQLQATGYSGPYLYEVMIRQDDDHGIPDGDAERIAAVAANCREWFL